VSFLGHTASAFGIGTTTLDLQCLCQDRDVDVAAVRALQGPEGARLLDSLPPYDEAEALATGTRLRRDGVDEALVAAALTQARLRARAVAKFGPEASRMLLTADGLEQATRPAVARRHAQRFAGAGVRSVADLCCGIGGDLRALAETVDRVLGVDRDPVTAEVARANVTAWGLTDRVDVRCADVLDLDLAGFDGAFIDPGRRGAAGRTFDPEAYSPPYGFVLDVAARVPATGAKLAPGIPHGVLPAGAEAEWVSDGGDVVECALWFGPLASGVRRRATVLPAGATLTGSGDERGDVGPVARYLYEPDGAVIRAGLVAEAAEQVAGHLVDPTIAYVTSDALARTPFLTPYEVTDVLPFGVKRLRALLRARGVGRVTVKKRGSAVTPEELRRQLRLSGPEEATVVLTRVAGAPTVLLVQPR
jgi:SAM-dependent methyltransferase